MQKDYLPRYLIKITKFEGFYMNMRIVLVAALFALSSNSTIAINNAFGEPIAERSNDDYWAGIGSATGEGISRLLNNWNQEQREDRRCEKESQTLREREAFLQEQAHQHRMREMAFQKELEKKNKKQSTGWFSWLW